jgi:hypothetical protein
MVTGAPPLITIRRTPVDEGTLVELFHMASRPWARTPPTTTAASRGGWTMPQLEDLRELVGD